MWMSTSCIKGVKEVHAWACRWKESEQETFVTVSLVDMERVLLHSTCSISIMKNEDSDGDIVDKRNI